MSVRLLNMKACDMFHLFLIFRDWITISQCFFFSTLLLSTAKIGHGPISLAPTLPYFNVRKH